jgi:hypothetical protein
METNESKDTSKKYLEVLAQNKISQSPFLSLLRLELTGNEPELADLVNFTWLEEIEIGIYYGDILIQLPKFPKSLKNLRIIGHKITDIQVISELPKLQKLHLMAMKCLSDIRPLAKLTTLETLSLHDSNVVDLSPLANLTRLEDLMLDYALSENKNLTDISPLAKLTKLQTLGITHSYLSDISPLAKLSRITDLELSNNQYLSDITPLASLKNIEDLSMSYCKVADISPLAVLPKLKTFELRGNPLKESVNRGLGKEVLNRFPSKPEIKAYLQSLTASAKEKNNILSALSTKPKRKVSRPIQLFPPISEVFYENTEENEQYFMPLANISLAAIDETLEGQIYLVYYYHDPYCETAGESYNDFCDNYLGTFDIIDGKYKFKTDFNFFAVNPENEQYRQDEQVSYQQQAKKQRLTPSRVVERLGKKPKGLYEENYPKDEQGENLLFICQVNMLNFIQTWQATDIFLFFDKKNQRAIQVFQWS